MPTIFVALGEHQDDPSRLLLLGEDGATYEQHLPNGDPHPVDVQSDNWVIDVPPEDATEAFL